MLNSRPGILTRRASALTPPMSTSSSRRSRRAAAAPPRASYGGGGGDWPPLPPPPPPEKSNAPVLYEEPPPPPPPPPPLPRFVADMPTSRRNVVGASLLFVGALLGFSNAFKDNNEDAFFGPKGAAIPEGALAGERPYRIVAGRVFVRTSSGDILSVNRAPEVLPDSDRTLMLMGDQGLFALMLTKEAMADVDLQVGLPLEQEDEFLTRVFASGDWENAAVAITPSKEEMKKFYEANGINEEAFELQDEKDEEREREEALAEADAEEMEGGGGKEAAE